ncbi:Rho guanine nucleotide exchange factor 6 [Willisornis vidua]|uniref:Rho guanine nucleotide exchange factor 6 n=1 Tax=Willisornis vidua TaxID=1566151 RepID=A0ABQ9CRF6_9PASS|nr:Rho guanine nucleotide exchange factor 6 [Willisornis vidua]
MNPEEQTVTWLISLGVLNSPKKIVDDPEEFLKTSLKDGTVLCKLINRLLPGSAEKYCLEPKNEADCISNIQEFLKGCALLKVEVFDPHDLYTGDQFSKVLSTLTAVNKATEGFALCFAVMQRYGGQLGKTQEMTENGSHQLVVKARFNFKQTNEDELSVNKGDIIYVTRVEEGGWWEGTLNGKTGWFPSNYVREIKSTDKPLSPKALKGLESTQLTKNYYPVVLQNILETERDYAKELQSLLGNYLRPLQSYDKLSAVDIASLLGNMEEISAFQQTLNQALEEVAKLPENQQRVGGCFMNLMPQFRSLYLTYCANHPSAVNVLTQHSDELEKFMESQGAANPGILILTTSLSKPFLRLDKYVTLLQELERHMEEAHADHEEVLKAITSFKSLVSQCQELRKRKQLELQILSESIQRWEGEDIKTMGNIIYMSQVMVQCGGSEEKEERYFLLFSNVLLMLSASPRMSGFIYQGKLPLTGMMLTKLEDVEGNEHMFEITGNMTERITVSCSSSQDLHEWLDHLQRLTKGTCSTISKTQSWSPHSDSSKSPKTMKKFLPKRKTERKPSDEEFVIRKSTAALEEDAQILKVIEAYCTGAGFQQALSSGSRKDSIPQVLLPEEEKIIIEETRSNGQTVTEEKSLVDTVYALKDEVKELKQENKRMKQCLEEELKSRKDLEKLVRRLLKQTDECGREDTGRKSSLIA